MSSCNDRKQFRSDGSRWSRHRLPSVHPEGSLLFGKVGLPIAVFSSLNWLQLTPIADQGYLNLYSRISIVWSPQSETGCGYFADHLAASVVTPRLPISYLCKRLFRLILVAVSAR